MKRLPLASFKFATALFSVLLVGLSFVARTAAPASDGAIAFLRLTRGTWQIWLMNADGTNLRQLTSSPMDKESPSWCPGAGIIQYYTSFGGAMLVDVRTGVEQLQEPLLPPIAAPRGPDGELLDLPSDLRRSLERSGFPQLAGLNCGDPVAPIGETVQLTASNLLPEGKAIAVLRRPDANPDQLFELKVVDTANALDFGRFRSDGKPSSTERVLSADGTLAFVSSEDGKSEVWIRKGALESEQLTHLGGNTTNPTWSPEGEWLAFDSDFQGMPQIYRLALSQRERLERLTDGRTPSRHPVYRPTVGSTP